MIALSTVMEVVTAILGGGLHVGVILQGKKISDDNKTLLQSGIAHAMSMEALAVVPLNRKSRRSELAQRRIRRPSSVSEVEALVQAVEKLGIGRAFGAGISNVKYISDAGAAGERIAEVIERVPEIDTDNNSQKTGSKDYTSFTVIQLKQELTRHGFGDKLLELKNPNKKDIVSLYEKHILRK